MIGLSLGQDYDCIRVVTVDIVKKKLVLLCKNVYGKVKLSCLNVTISHLPDIIVTNSFKQSDAFFGRQDKFEEHPIAHNVRLEGPRFSTIFTHEVVASKECS